MQRFRERTHDPRGAAVVVIAGLYVEQVAQERAKMIQIKILSTFFQTAEPTTHIDIAGPPSYFGRFLFGFLWPTPIVSPRHGGILDGTLLIPYVPLFFFAFMYRKWRVLPVGSSREKNVQQLGVFLMLFWYAPLLQSAAAMYDCVQDPTLRATITTSKSTPKPSASSARIPRWTPRGSPLWTTSTGTLLLSVL